MKNILLSRKFWVALLAFVAVVIGAFLPDFDLNTEEAASFAIIAVTYLVGVAVDPGPGGWAGVLRSRKFWAAITGFLLVWLNAFQITLPFNLSPDQLISLAVVVGGYIAGVALEGKSTAKQQAQPKNKPTLRARTV